MVICRYFLQGTCKFGNNCRYEHSYREYENEGPPPNSYRRTYGVQYQESPNRYSQSPGATNVRELMQAVINELNQGEKGGQWPLSCFAPFKEKPCYPGLDDYSPEEIRWQMYEAVKTGTVEECKRRIQQLEESYRTKKNLILHPNAETYTTVEKLFRGEITATTNFAQGSQFAPAPPANFSFNIAQHGNEKKSTPSLFGGASPAFVSGNTVAVPSLFGGARETAQQMNVFSMAAQNIPTANVFGQIPTSSVSNHSTETKNVFSIGTGTPNSSSFFTNAQQTSFSNSQLQPSGGFTQKATQPPVVSSMYDDSLYTPTNELTESERTSFTAQTFTMGHIPTRPPPREFCS